MRCLVRLVVILHHVLEGEGPAVLLLHSTATDGRQWQPQIHELRRDFHVVAPDLRGYGRSPLTPEPFSHSGDVVELMDHLGLERFAVVGSSGGGAVALQVASTVPERVTPSSCCAPRPTGSSRPAICSLSGSGRRHCWTTATWSGRPNSTSTCGCSPTSTTDARAVPRDAGERLPRAARRRRRRPRAGRRDRPRTDHLPTTVVTGARDLPWFGAIGDHLAAELPRAVRVDLPWAGHLPNLERPAETTELIRRSIRP